MSKFVENVMHEMPYEQRNVENVVPRDYA